VEMRRLNFLLKIFLNHSVADDFIGA